MCLSQGTVRKTTEKRHAENHLQERTPRGDSLCLTMVCVICRLYSKANYIPLLLKISCVVTGHRNHIPSPCFPQSKEAMYLEMSQTQRNCHLALFPPPAVKKHSRVEHLRTFLANGHKKKKENWKAPKVVYFQTLNWVISEINHFLVISLKGVVREVPPGDPLMICTRSLIFGYHLS